MLRSNFHMWRAFAEEALGVSMFIFKGFCVLQCTRSYIFQAAYVNGPSMLPTFNLTGSLVLVDVISSRMGKLGRGDVVVVKSPENPRKSITKRLTGMEGDRITFVADPRNSDKSEIVVVPKGHVWVQGDNVYDSRDSRHFGALPYALVEGRVFWRVWPPKEFGSV